MAREVTVRRHALKRRTEKELERAHIKLLESKISGGCPHALKEDEAIYDNSVAKAVILCPLCSLPLTELDTINRNFATPFLNGKQMKTHAVCPA